MNTVQNIIDAQKKHHEEYPSDNKKLLKTLAKGVYRKIDQQRNKYMCNKLHSEFFDQMQQEGYIYIYMVYQSENLNRQNIYMIYLYTYLTKEEIEREVEYFNCLDDPQNKRIQITHAAYKITKNTRCRDVSENFSYLAC